MEDNSRETCTCTDDCAIGFNPGCNCTCNECDCRNIANMIGAQKEQVFYGICEFLDSNYQMDKLWKRQKVKTIEDIKRLLLIKRKPNIK